MVNSHSETPLGVGTSHGHFGPQDTPRPGLGSKPPPYSLQYTLWLSAAPTPECHFFPRLPGWSPETVPGGVPGLWELITPDCKVWSRRGLNQTCSPQRDLFNDVLHSQFGGWEEVDSWLLVVGSQIASLTPGPSFAHNLGYRCSNDQCEAIFYIYASRPFHWHQEHLNARCFELCCRALNIRESRRTPNPQLWKCWASPPHLAKVGLRRAVLHLGLVLHHIEDGLGNNIKRLKDWHETMLNHTNVHTKPFHE